MENIVLLDTGIIIDFFGGKKSASGVEVALVESRAALSAITIYELFNGVNNRDHIKQREQFIKLCEIVKIDEQVARKASSLYTRLKLQGKLICHEDILIAACALSRTYPLFSNNQRHFRNIPGLTFYKS